MKHKSRVVLVTLAATIAVGGCTSHGSTTVSTAPTVTKRTAKMPNVVGLNYPVARQALHDLGLGLNVEVCCLYTTKAVWRQRPAPGRAVEAGATVYLDLR